MNTRTRGPRTGKVPPHIQDRVDAKRSRAERLAILGPWYRRNPFIAVLVGLLGLILGSLLTWWLTPDPVAGAAAEAEDLMLSADQASLIWSMGSPSGIPAVAQARSELGNGATDLVTQNLDGWIQAYTQQLNSLQGEELPPASDGVRRLLIDAVQLNLDAVETLGAAATVEPPARDLLLLEVDRLHTRAVEADASARELLGQLLGTEAGAPPEVPTPVPSLPRPEVAPPPDAVVPSLVPPVVPPGPEGSPASS